jgi:site-specific DNA-cytosine methylase
MNKMRVLIACEFSGVVRNAFRKLGHEAYSCDIIPSDDNSKDHVIADILTWVEYIVPRDFDLMIAHPPCTHLCVSGARWFKDKKEEQKEAIEFFMKLANAKIPKICIENPI